MFLSVIPRAKLWDYIFYNVIGPLLNNVIKSVHFASKQEYKILFIFLLLEFVRKGYAKKGGEKHLAFWVFPYQLTMFSIISIYQKC